jgi:hypothetical protein
MRYTVSSDRCPDDKQLGQSGDANAPFLCPQIMGLPPVTATVAPET